MTPALDMLKAARGQADRIIARKMALKPSQEVLYQYLHPKQRGMADDSKQFQTWCCGRRFGKTTLIAALLLLTAKKFAKRAALYLTLTGDMAKANLWPTLVDLNQLFGLGGTPLESNLTMTMPNGAAIMLRGVDKQKEIEKKRGMAYGLSIAVVDECQSIGEYIRALIDDVIGPALVDVQGRLILSGTPSLLKAGYWYECHHNPDGVWSHYSYTLFDNPTLPDPRASLAAECARRGVSPDVASIRREWFAEWVRDLASAVFAFSPEANGYEPTTPNTWNGLPLELQRELWQYVIGVDLGGGVQRDNDAITALAFHPDIRCTWLTYEKVMPKRDVSGVCHDVKRLWTDLGQDKVVAIVVDTGGIGAKIALEMSSRWHIPTSPADKKDKWANIELLNAACRNGEFKAPVKSAFARECVKVEKDWDKSTPEKFKIKGHMPDVCDSVLYGYVESLGWLSKVPDKKPVRGTAEHEELIRKALFERTKREMRRHKQEKEVRAGDFGVFEQMDDWGSGIDISQGWGDA